MKANIKNSHGITLISLVVTIVVLLILSGITIGTLAGDNGLIQKAKAARANATSREEQDKELVDDLYSDINNGNKLPPSQIMPGNPDEEGYFTEPSTINGGEVSVTNPKIPAGFMPIDEGDAVWGDRKSVPTTEAVDKGLVIQDKNGNQFVWVPVPVFSDFEREAGYYNGAKESFTSTTEGLENEKYYEPKGDGTTVDTTAGEDLQEVQKMYKSVNINKGFYIGRYETGFEGNEAKRTYISYTTYTQENVNTEASKLLIQANKQVYNYVPWGAGMEDTSALNAGTAASPAYVIGAVELSRNFDSVNNYDGVASTLCYGVQWDAVMRWMNNVENPNATGSLTKYIQDSTKMGWYSNNYSSGNASHQTGIDVDATASNKVKNIYDMAGNVIEWTMEAYRTVNRVGRGGFYSATDKSHPASIRFYNKPYSYDDSSGFRLALYVE